MKLRNDLLLEKKIILKSRATLVLAVLLLVITVWVGFVKQYDWAMHSEQRLIDIDRGIQLRVREHYERYGITVIADPEFIDVQREEIFQPLHPVAGPNNILSILAMIGPIAIAIWGANIVGSEFSARTVKIRAAHYGWANSIVVKGIAIILLSFFIAAAGSLLGLIGGHVTWGIVLGASELAHYICPPDIPFPLWQQMGLLTVGLSFYGMLAAFAAAATRSSLGGAAIAGFFWYAEQIFTLPSWFPANVYDNLLVNTFKYFPGGMQGPPPFFSPVEPLWLCWIILIAWCIAIFLLTWQISKRQAI